MKTFIWGRTRLGAAMRVAAVAALASAALGATGAGSAGAAGAVSVTVSASPSPATTGHLGQPLAYTILVTNNGSTAATGLTLTDTLNGLVPGPIQGLPGPRTTTSTGTCSYSSPTETCTAPSLAAGGVWTVRITGAVCLPPSNASSTSCPLAPNGGTLTDQATVTGTEGGSFTSSGSTTVAVNPSVPAGFAQTTLATGLKDPTTLAFAPNGDIYIGEQAGTILVYRSGALLGTPLGTIPNVYGQIECGLLGMALDPNYATNGYIYISYTANVTNTQGTTQQLTRLSRFTVSGGALSPASEKIYYQGNQQQTSGHHSGNDLQVGPDGKLWWSVGDNVPSISNGETLTNIYGKVLRFNLDGSVPADNPYIDVPGAVPYIYSYGLRNPFRFTFLPNGKLMTEDTGSSFWETFKTLAPGANFGWPYFEGPCGSCGYANPTYSYGHLPVDAATSAVAAYSGSTFPTAYDHVVFFGDYNRQDIEAVSFDPSYQIETSDTVFDTAAGTIADLAEGPDGNLYFVGIFEGKFYKISPAGPFNPTASAGATPSAGPGPLDVQFSSAGSSDPYGNALAYSWNFGDGSATSTAANPSHTYTTNGTYTATLTVSNGAQTGQATTTVVVGPSPPSAAITAPTAYNAGDTVAFSGSASDPQDGALPPSAYSWTVDFYSNGVAQPSYLDEIPYPFYGPAAGITSGTFKIPTDPSQTPSSFYRITLTVTDSLGLKTVVSKDLHPNTTSWSANTNVAGTGYYVDGYWQTGSYTAQDVVGVKHVLMGLGLAQTIGANRYRFLGWSDGSAMSDTITAGPPGATYTALYDPVGAVPAGWTSVDIGAPLEAGRADYSAGDKTFTIDGSGADVYNPNDQFHYTYQTISGNATITARVRYQTASSPWAKAGVMIKQAATAGSPFVDALVTPDVSPNTPNISCVGYTVNGCDAPLPPVNPTYGYGDRTQYSTGTGTGGQGPPATPGGTSPNKWVKLQRVGNAFTSFESTDGVNWTQIGATSVSMTGPVTIGLFVTSHNIGQYSTVSFDNVQITGQTTGGALPAPWADTDVGSPAPAGTATYSNGTFTVQGSGADIYGTSDQFNYTYQPTTGNGTIIARVTSQSNTSSNAKAGVMFKQSTTAGSNYILIAVAPAGNIKVQYNFKNSTGAATYSFPNVWMKLVRNGTTFTAYTSPDGSTWTQVLSTTAPNLTSNATVGIFECSHKAGVLGTATFDNVTWTPGP